MSERRHRLAERRAALLSHCALQRGELSQRTQQIEARLAPIDRGINIVYAVPGMVIATVGLLKTTPDPTDADIAKLMDRNVCRCGTYPRITQAIKLAAERVRARTLAEGRPR